MKRHNQPEPRCAEQAAWVVEPRGIVLIHLAHGRRRNLAYPEAAVWDLLIRRRPAKTICSMLELIAGISPPEAEELAASCLKTWTEEGWLVPIPGKMR